MIFPVEDTGFRMTIDSISITQFVVGDKIGWSSTDDNHWAGTIVLSEPDPEGWHLAWADERRPGVLFHWRGESSKRDTRWCAEDQYLIDELP